MGVLGVGGLHVGFWGSWIGREDCGAWEGLGAVDAKMPNMLVAQEAPEAETGPVPSKDAFDTMFRMELSYGFALS